jgi:hypothetical protein
MSNLHIESYQEIPLFEGLNEAEVSEIVSLAKPRWFEKDEVRRQQQFHLPAGRWCHRRQKAAEQSKHYNRTC